MWRDIYQKYIAEHVQANRTTWNNLSNSKKIIAEYAATEDELNSDWFQKWDSLQDYEQKGVESFDDCAHACNEHGDDCVQWQWEHGRCYLSTEVRLGMTDDREESSWESGWNLERIEHRLSAREPCYLRWND